MMEPYGSSGSFSSLDLLHYTNTISGSLASQETKCRKIGQKAYDAYGTIPPTKSFELYLVLGIAIPPGGSEKDARVVFEPEFIFVLDVDFESLIGVSVFWTPVGAGDPRFPDLSKSSLRSISSRDSGHIIFPFIPGSVMIGVKDGISDNDIRNAFKAAGLRNIQGSSWFWTAQCEPFAERRICNDLENKISFVKYANRNKVVRRMDFEPGWSCVRLT
jgi:hypothetical protein